MIQALSPTSFRVLQMPLWLDSQLDLPAGYEVRKDRNSDLVVLVNTRNGDFVGIRWPNFDPSNLGELVNRIA